MESQSSFEEATVAVWTLLIFNLWFSSYYVLFYSAFALLTVHLIKYILSGNHVKMLFWIKLFIFSAS
jgi:hypothetical protein